MKKTLIVLMVMVMAANIVFAGGSSESADGTFTPSKDIEWVVTSSPGGGSDIFTRTLVDIITKEGLIEETFLINNQTDGAGEVGRLRVSTSRDDGHLLLTFNSADLRPMVLNTPNRIEKFKPVAIMAADRQLFVKGNNTPYADLAEAIAAAKAGTPVTMGGSKGDDITVYEMFIAEVGLTEEQMPYIVYDATSDAITAMLGGHVDLALVKPASVMPYIESGDAYPVVTIALERYTGALADVPILSEIGDYENFELPLWRGVVTSGQTPDAAVAFYSEVLAKVAETDAWKDGYLTKNQLANAFMTYEEATPYMKDFQEQVLATK